MRYYEDFEIGESKVMGSYSVSAEEIVEFAKRWDPQPFHIDVQAAKESMFAGLTASSCHTYAIASLITHNNPEGIALLAMLSTELKAPKPVYAGDTLTQTSQCVAKRLSESRPGVGIVKTLATLTNQQGEVAFELISHFMVKTRDSL